MPVKKRKPAAKKATTKRATKTEALKKTGGLKKGYKYVKGGGVVKVVKSGLGKAANTCVRINEDGSSSTYTAHGNSKPCPNGGTFVPGGLGKRKAVKKRK